MPEGFDYKLFVSDVLREILKKLLLIVLINPVFTVNAITLAWRGGGIMEHPKAMLKKFPKLILLLSFTHYVENEEMAQKIST